MPIRIEAYVLGGIVTGLLAWPGHLRDALEGATELLVEEASFAPLDGRARTSAGNLPVVVDDVVLAVPDEPMPGPVHAAWHAVELEAGPYHVEGELATMPGFDPGRALARPTGTFVLLRDVRVRLLGQPDAGIDSHAQGLVNRYLVDAVDADLMLGFFFPGARIAVDPSGGAVTTAGPANPAGAAPTGAEPGTDAGPAPASAAALLGDDAPPAASDTSTPASNA
jgi:hypothetical protein